MGAMGEKSLALSDATFDEQVQASPLPVLVDFWCSICGPCKMLAPTLAELAAEEKGRMILAKVNVADNPETVARFEVMSTPTLIVFRHGKPVKRMIGARPKSTLHKELEEALA
jgi:thioredoxin 1